MRKQRYLGVSRIRQVLHAVECLRCGARAGVAADARGGRDLGGFGAVLMVLKSVKKLFT
jgi:hypothetical protein